MKRVYWDANCFIDFLKGNERGRQLVGVVEAMERGELQIVSSVIVLTEVLKLDDASEESKQRIIDTFDEDEGILIVDLTRHLAEEARSFIWKHDYQKRKMDSIHLATAVYLNQYQPIAEIHSFDDDFLKLNGSSDIPIPIVKPNAEIYPQKPPRLFDGKGNVLEAN